MAFPPKTVSASPWVEKSAASLKVTSLKFASWVKWVPLNVELLIKVDPLKSALP